MCRKNRMNCTFFLLEILLYVEIPKKNEKKVFVGKCRPSCRAAIIP